MEEVNVSNVVHYMNEVAKVIESGKFCSEVNGCTHCPFADAKGFGAYSDDITLCDLIEKWEIK